MVREILRATGLRVLALLRRRRLEQDLEDEIAFHLAMREQERRAAGLGPDDARAAARRRFGNALALKDSLRDLWTIRPLEQVAQDVRYGLRTLRRDSVFASVAVLSLTLGVAAASAIFALRDATLLRPLPVTEPDRLVVPHWIAEAPSVSAGAWISGCGQPGDCALPYSLYERLSEPARSHSGMAAFSNPQSVQMGLRGAVSLVDAQFVSGSFFSVVGLKPALGRALARSDDGGAGEPVVVLSDAFWRRLFAADRGTLGQTVLLNGSPFTIVGVAPPGFFGLDPAKPPAMWIPLHAAARLESGSPFFNPKVLLDDRARVLGTIARLRAGRGVEEARAEIVERFRSAVRTGTTVFDPAKGADVALVDGARGLNALEVSYREPLRLLGRLVGLVLAVACANVACLLLARAVTRRREIALRMAIGAGRRRLLAQLVTEGLVLSLVGAVAGLAIGFGGSRLLALLLSPDLQEGALAWTRPGTALLGLTTGIVVITTLVFALVPAWAAGRVEPACDLQPARTVGEGTRRAGRRSGRVAQWIVTAEVAGTVVLLVGAGLFVRTILNFVTLDRGFRTDHLLTVEVSPVVGATGAPDVSAEIAALQAHLEGLAGVESATWASQPFLGEGIEFRGLLLGSGKDMTVDTLAWFSVGPHFFRTMGMPLIAGRDVAAEDLGAPSAWINRSLAGRRFSGRDSVGAPVRLAGDWVDRAVAGVVPDTDLGYIGQGSARRPVVYVASADARCLLLRTAVPPRSLARTVETAVHRVAPHLLVRSIVDEGEHLRARTRDQRLLATASLALGGMVLILAAVGVYGVLSYSVARRRGEIAIRMSLGASRRDILCLVLGEGSRAVLAGAALGSVGAYWTVRSFTRLLFGVRPLDPPSYAAAALLLAVVAGLATYLPASRAGRIDPAAALRAE